ncbi:MAG: hypothetical protein EAY75_03585 [Bacteroidetes bacterium]|nr:MAG: hypothetical protein EAY75_03585 [Bacteroidota bacterium]
MAANWHKTEGFWVETLLKMRKQNIKIFCAVWAAKGNAGYGLAGGHWPNSITKAKGQGDWSGSCPALAGHYKRKAPTEA